ncbi:MAG: hypothetical protein AOA66_0721 [Candidatus Bathyarchaeota archaeon BA2]|nr:MAG: hypothetical protein AOA66_0721 [Candidatus Bathyarchaeota archaeon BA2]
MKRKWLAATFLAILLMSLAMPLIALPVGASEEDDDNHDFRIVPEGENWYKLESDIVTVLFPAGGRKPMFIWWYTGAPDQIYVVKFRGLMEWFAFDHPSLPPKPEYYKRLREAWPEWWRERFQEMYFRPAESWCIHMGKWGELALLRSIVN